MDELKQIFNSVPGILGQTYVGGGKKKKAKKTKMHKMKMRKVPRKYRMGFFGGDQKYMMCTDVDISSLQQPQRAPDRQQPMLPAKPMQPEATAPAGPQLGGSSMRMGTYKKKLNNMTVEKLQKLAARKGVKITKKKDGKTVYVKKDTLVRKLCECKMKKRKSGTKK